MRLTTLARKIQITPTKLMEYLKKNDVDINNGVNTILDDNTVAMVLDKFMAKSALSTVTTEHQVLTKVADIEQKKANHSTPEPVVKIDSSVIEKKAEPTVEMEDKKVVPNSESLKVSEKKIPLPKTGTIDDLELGLSEDIELIKAKKVKLEGIKVIGKIDIPEKVKKVQAADEEGNSESPKDELKRTATSRPDRPNKKFNKQKSLKADKNQKNLTYEEKLKLEEKEKLRIQKQKARKEKERKKKYYLKNIQPKTLGQPKKKQKKSVEESSANTQPVVVHKNPLRRFWDWLNGVYDQY